MSLPETTPTTFAVRLRTGPVMSKFPDSLAPSCWNEPLMSPEPICTLSYCQDPTQLPDTLTDGGALGPSMLAQPATATAVTSTATNRVRITFSSLSRNAENQSPLSLSAVVSCGINT